MPDPTASTKLRLPSPRRGIVVRPRLEADLPGASEVLPRLVLVAAPAGSGKTTVLAQWLAPWDADDSVHVAWLSLDAADNDPHCFLTALVAAIGDHVGQATRNALRAGAGPAGVVTALVNDLETAGGSTVIALDDYHVIENAEVSAAVGLLVEHLPRTVSLAIGTRSDPLLPLARLRARGELLELRASDLAFTETEAREFLNDAMGLRLEEEAVRELARRTEGWAAGLQLAGLSLRGRRDVAGLVSGFGGSHRFILDYLVEEVLSSQPEQVRSFLLETAILGHLHGSLCDAVTGRAGGREQLEALERANLFVVSLDDRRQWFRYHHLFAEALRARLAAERPARLPDLHRAAATWYDAAGRPADAVAHALACGDALSAADLIEAAVPDASRRRQDRTLQRWATALPDEVVRARPGLAVMGAWSRLSDGDVDGAEERLDDAEAGLAATDPATVAHRDLPLTIAMYRAAVAQARGDTSGTAQQARRMLDLAGPEDHFARGAGAGFLALSQWAMGDVGAATQTFEGARRSLRAAGNVTDELGSAVVMADLWVTSGRLDQAQRVVAEALERREACPEVAMPVAGDLHVAMAEVLRERGDLGAARSHLDAAHSLGDVASLPENRHRWHVAHAGLAIAAGDLDEAMTSLDRADELHRPGFFPAMRPIPALRARVALAAGRIEEARGWVAEHPLPESVTPLSEFEHLTHARLLISEGRAEDALVVLDRLLGPAKEGGRRGSVVQVLVVHALAQQARGDSEAAAGALGSALEIGVPAGFARTFLDEGPVMRDLLGTLAARGADAPRRLLALGQGVPRPEGPVPLSVREVEVLRMLATELTGPEIARHLFVSVNTLRTHTRNIFTKLDATTRAAAVRRGRALGVL